MKALPFLQVLVLVLGVVSLGMAAIAAVHGAWPQAFHSTLNAVGAGVIWYFGNRLVSKRHE